MSARDIPIPIVTSKPLVLILLSFGFSLIALNIFECTIKIPWLISDIQELLIVTSAPKLLTESKKQSVCENRIGAVLRSGPL